MEARQPTAALILDLFIHRDLGHRPEADLGPFSQGKSSDDALLRLDKHPSGLASKDVRPCQAIAEYVCTEAGVNPDDFAKYRVRVEFPVLHERLWIRWKPPT